MSALATGPLVLQPPAPPVSPAELAELMAVFNQVTARLEGTHESLRSEVRRLQQELRDANEQLQRSKRLAALGEMAAGIAHEVRNPLGSIGLYARMLEQDLGDRPDERGIAAKIAAAVRGLDGVVNDVLCFSREMRLNIEAVDAGELLDRALETCWTAEPLIADGVRVVQRDTRKRGGIRNGLRTRLRCDPHLMHQALVNIIRNALQAMAETQVPAGGHELTLDVGPVRGDEGKAMFGISIADSGPGVPPEVIDRIFNPFFTTRKTGTGLGLAIVHRIVDAHGGLIQLTNNATRTPTARGATVRVLVPERADTQKFDSAAPGAASSQQEARG